MTTATLPPALKRPLSTEKFETYNRVETYYDVAGPDYAYWSRNFNMHFGYCNKFTDIFSLERMLRKMNGQVLKNLRIPTDKNVEIADLGCGMGAVARYAAALYPAARITGTTISGLQIVKGNELCEKEGLSDKVLLIPDNFENSIIPAKTFDLAYAVESACHARFADKRHFIAEMARILKPAGKFCIADGFIKHENKLPGLFSRINQKITDCWALPCFGQLNPFIDCLKKNGFTNIEVKEISWNIAPSVAYVPWTVLKFFVAELWKNKSLKMEKERWNNVKAPLLGMILGLYRRHFGYYIISGEKMEN